MSTPSTPPSAAAAEPDIDLREYVGVLARSRLAIAAGVLLALVLGAAYALLTPPRFRSDVLLQVEQKNKGLGGLEELSTLFGNEAPAETEMEILRSRFLLGSVVDELHLEVEVDPVHAPVVGAALARRHKGEALAPVRLGLARYAWGGERLVVKALDVPTDVLEHACTLVAGESGAWTLLDEDGERVLEGRVGQRAEDRASGYVLFVSELRAHPGARFELTRRARSEVIRDLQEKLELREKGKKTGIIEASLEGRDRERVARTLDAVANAYLRQNVERKSEDAEKTLQFLETQLPVVKANLDAAEVALNQHRLHQGAVDLPMEAEKMLERAVAVEGAISQLDVQRAELKQRFTESHPALLAMQQQMQQLQHERAVINARFKDLPDKELSSVRLTRDVKVANELYLLLLNKTQELKVVKSGTIGNVRILDRALVALKPVWPRSGLVLALSAVLGLLATVTFVFVRNALQQGVEDPALLESEFGLPTYASVLHSTKQSSFIRAFERKRAQRIEVLALADPGDQSVESLRSLRTSLQFALMDAKNNVVTISGPSPGVGKSFVSANLAHVLSESGRRVLLIDADMRRGHLHDYFGLERATGLSEVISGAIELQAALRTTGSANLSFLPTGVVPPNPSELLMSDRFRRLLDAASKEFDLVLVDTPPVLAVTDSAIVGRLAGVNLVVIKSGQHPVRELAAMLKRLEQNGVRAHGAVFNDVPAARGVNSFHYQYDYR